MRVLHLSTFDTLGGAALAAQRLHAALLQAGVDSHLYTQFRQGNSPRTGGPAGKAARAWAAIRPEIDRLPLHRYRRRTGDFHLSWLPRDLTTLVARTDPDIVHLHWIEEGFLSAADLTRIRRPLVWTLHDMWPLTGGCHYAGDCRRWTGGCGRCPLLGSGRHRDLSRWTWRRKARCWRRLPLHLVAPSRWMAAQAAASPLLNAYPCTELPNAVDTDRFRPLERRLARRWLGLPEERPLVLFGALNALDDRRKGADLLAAALHHEASRRWPAGTTVVVFGAPPPVRPAWPQPTVVLGRLSDAPTLALLYGACDVFVVPSRQDNLPNTIAEALACGTPCAGFAVGGIPEMITHQASGYLARPGDPGDLARGIGWVLASDAGRRGDLGRAARATALARFDAKRVVRRHLTLYEACLK